MVDPRYYLTHVSVSSIKHAVCYQRPQLYFTCIFVHLECDALSLEVDGVQPQCLERLS